MKKQSSVLWDINTANRSLVDLIKEYIDSDIIIQNVVPLEYCDDYKGHPGFIVKALIILKFSNED